MNGVHAINRFHVVTVGEAELVAAVHGHHSRDPKGKGRSDLDVSAVFATHHPVEAKAAIEGLRQDLGKLEQEATATRLRVHEARRVAELAVADLEPVRADLVRKATELEEAERAVAGLVLPAVRGEVSPAGVLIRLDAALFSVETAIDVGGSVEVDDDAEVDTSAPSADPVALAAAEARRAAVDQVRKLLSKSEKPPSESHHLERTKKLGQVSFLKKEKAALVGLHDRLFAVATEKIEEHNAAVAEAERANQVFVDALGASFGETVTRHVETSAPLADAVFRRGASLLSAVRDHGLEEAASVTSSRRLREHLKVLTGQEKGLLVEAVTDTPLEHGRRLLVEEVRQHERAHAGKKPPKGTKVDANDAREWTSHELAHADLLRRIGVIDEAMGGVVAALQSIDLEGLKKKRDAAVSAEVDRLRSKGLAVLVTTREDQPVSPDARLAFLTSEVARLASLVGGGR